jgi:hypothetical protein
VTVTDPARFPRRDLFSIMYNLLEHVQPLQD